MRHPILYFFSFLALPGCGSCHTDGAFDGNPDMEHCAHGSCSGKTGGQPFRLFRSVSKQELASRRPIAGDTLLHLAAVHRYG